MITVLMTTYNCGEYISQAIKSILNQTYKNFELLIIDDGSQDDTEVIVGHFADTRIRYCKRKHTGRAASLNYGLQMAENSFIALMDADDIAHPLRLEKQLKNIHYKENTISCTWAIYFKDNSMDFSVKTPSDKLFFKEKMAIHSYICNPSVMFKKKFILSNGGYLESLSSSEDYELWLRLLNKVEFIVCEEYLLFQRQRINSLSRKDIKSVREQVNFIHKKYANLKSYFSVSDNKQLVIEGWREYFYGNRVIARKKWYNLGLKLILYPKVFTAFFATFLNDKYFLWLWKKRLRLIFLFRIEKLFSSRIQNADRFLMGFLKNN